MDPVSIVVSALVVGMAAGLKPTAEQAVKDAYQGLKTIIQDKYKIHLESLEKKPGSKTQQDAVREEITDAKVAEDAEVIDKATAVVEAVDRAAPETAKTVGVNLIDVKAGIVTFKNIHAQTGGTGVNVERGEFKELNFGNVDASGTDPKNE